MTEELKIQIKALKTEADKAGDEGTVACCNVVLGQYPYWPEGGAHYTWCMDKLQAHFADVTAQRDR